MKPLLIPMTPEIKEVAENVFRLRSKLRQNEQLPHVMFEFYDDETAQVAVGQIQNFRVERLKFNSETASDKLETLSPNNVGTVQVMPRFKQYVIAPLDDYIPKEFFGLFETIRRTRIKALPISPQIGRLLVHFFETYESLPVITAYHSLDDVIVHLEKKIKLCDVIQDNAQELGFEGISKLLKYTKIENFHFDENLNLHEFLLKLGSLVKNVLSKKQPVEITVSGNARNLIVSIASTPLKLNRTKVQAVAALTLLEYTEWFELKNFCELAFSNTYNPKNQFDAALKDLKKFPPFGWEASSGKRRMNGVVIKRNVTKEVIGAYLSRKTAI